MIIIYISYHVMHAFTYTNNTYIYRYIYNICIIHRPVARISLRGVEHKIKACFSFRTARQDVGRALRRYCLYIFLRSTKRGTWPHCLSPPKHLATRLIVRNKVRECYSIARYQLLITIIILVTLSFSRRAMFYNQFKNEAKHVATCTYFYCLFIWNL